MAWFKDAWATVSDALGVRKYIALFSAGGGSAALAAAYAWLRDQPDMTWLPALPTWAAFLILLEGMLLFWVLNYATKLRKSHEPKILISADGFNDDLCIPGRTSTRWNVGIRNVGGEELRACKVKVVFDNYAHTICEPFNLAVGEYVTVSPLRVVREDPVDPSNRKTTMIIDEIHRNASGNRPVNCGAGNQEFILEALSANSQPDRRKVSLANDDGRWTLTVGGADVVRKVG